MGKGQKGKGKQGQKPSGKGKQRSAQNKKQLAKVERILQNKKDRSQSKPSKGGRQQNKFENRSQSRPNRGGRQQNKFEKSNGNKDFQKGRPQSQERRQEKRGGSRHQRGASEWTEKTNKKTKQINKQFVGGRQPNMKKKGGFAGDNEGTEVIKGNPLFKIIPEGMDEDAFAALGGNSAQQHSQQINDSEASSGSGEGEGEEYEQQYDYGDDQQEGDEEEEMQDGEQDEQQMMQGEQGQDEQFDEQQEGEEQQQQHDQDDQQDGQQEQQANEQQQNQQQQQMEQQQQQGGIELPDDKQPVDISVISLKIQQTIQILMNVAKLGGGRSRKEHLEDLKNLIHQYYGYNFQLINHFLDFLNPSELIQFFEANETQRPLTIRTNTLKTRRKELAQSLIQRGVNLDPLADWSNVGIKIYETKVPIGATPEYLAGHYMLQSASSFLPVIALDPQPYEKILDMASAPGGKTTYIAQLMKNTGSLFANDLKKERLRALQFNLYRLGVTNTAVTCRDGRKFASIFPSTFDRILLDAPCTGLGIISKDPSIKATRQMIDIYKNSHLQKELLLSAIDSCKVNGTIVYSTCSVSPLENEEVVNYALKRRFVKIVDCGIEVGEEGLTKFVEKRFHVDLKKTRRIYPHVHNMDGFYVAKLVKIGKGKKQVKEEQGAEQNKVMEVEQQVQEE